jgi:hypothetical protein
VIGEKYIKQRRWLVVAGIRFAFGVWRLAFGVWRSALGVRRSASSVVGDVGAHGVLMVNDVPVGGHSG